MPRKYKQEYRLNGNFVTPGTHYILMLHRARKDHPYEDGCLDCGEPILKGQEYITRSMPFCYGWEWHKDCFLESHGDTTDIIIGIKKERKVLNSFGIWVKPKGKKPRYYPTRTFITCVTLSSLLDGGRTE